MSLAGPTYKPGCVRGAPCISTVPSPAPALLGIVMYIPEMLVLRFSMVRNVMRAAVCFRSETSCRSCCYHVMCMTIRLREQRAYFHFRPVLSYNERKPGPFE